MMKPPMPKKTETQPTTLTDKEVIAFLKENPDFLKNNPALLDILSPPSAANGKGVADFQKYMIERLKADKDDFVANTREIIETARSNMNNQYRIHKAVLRLLEASTFEDFIHCITLDFSSLLDVDISVLVIETPDAKVPHIHENGIRMVPKGTLDQWMAGKSILLQDNISGIEAIYGGGAALIGSQILLRVDISMNTPPAILAFGSRDPTMFHEGQATDQILFLARVIERCFRTWLSLPS